MKRFTEEEYIDLITYEAEIGSKYGTIALLQFRKFIEEFHFHNKHLEFGELLYTCELLVRGFNKN